VVLDLARLVKNDAVELDTEERAEVLGPQHFAFLGGQVFVSFHLLDFGIGGVLRQHFFVAGYPMAYRIRMLISRGNVDRREEQNTKDDKGKEEKKKRKKEEEEEGGKGERGGKKATGLPD
jgi:hypothetical protein